MFKQIAFLLRETVREWVEDSGSAIAAALAYYSIFSLSPLLIVLALFLGLVMDRNTIEASLISNVEVTVGQQVAEVMRSLISNAEVSRSDVIGTITWFAVVIWGASGIFAQLQNALNRIWEVRAKPGRSPLFFVQNRLLSFLVVVLSSSVFLLTMVLNTSLNTFLLNHPGTVTVIAIRAGQALLSVAMITFMVGLLFKVLPDVNIHWRDVLVGSAFTAFLLFAGQFAVGLYLANANVGSVFGAAGSLTAILVWIYYTAQILLFGAEFTEVWAMKHGFSIVPSRGAVWNNEAQARREAERAGRTWEEIESRSGRGKVSGFIGRIPQLIPPLRVREGGQGEGLAQSDPDQPAD